MAITAEKLSIANYNKLDNIPVINQDLSASDFTPVANTYYRHTGATTDTFTQGVIYYYDGTEYKALDGSGSGPGGISDVKVAGTSVVTDGVANIPVSDKNVKGVVSDVVRNKSQFKLITGTYRSGYLSPFHQSNGFVLAKDENDDDGFAIYPNTSWGNIIYAGYQNSPLHLYVSVGDSLDYEHIGFYRIELRRYSSASNYNAIKLPTISGTMMVAPSTWSSGTSGSLTLSGAGLYEVKATIGLGSFSMIINWDGSTTSYSASCGIQDTDAQSLALWHFEVNSSGVVTLNKIDNTGSKTTNTEAVIKYRKIGIA